MVISPARPRESGDPDVFWIAAYAGMSGMPNLVVQEAVGW
jgi:hypothetical protein